MPTAEALLVRSAEITNELVKRRTAAGGGWSLSANASVLGGYSESLVATLFLDWPTIMQDAGLDEVWRSATQLKTSVNLGLKSSLRWTGRTDSADLVTHPLSPQTAILASARLARTQLVADIRKLRRSLVVQVKSRIRWDDLNYDALHYRYLLEVPTGGLSRADLVAGGLQQHWLQESPDLYAWVLWEPTQTIGKRDCTVRLATREQVRLAILAVEARNASANPRTRDTRYSFSGTKLGFHHVFGVGDYWSGSSGMDQTNQDLQSLPGCQSPSSLGWTQWAVGEDVTDLLAPSPIV